MSQPRSLLIYGAGDRGQVVADTAVAAGWNVLGFLDDYREIKSVMSFPMLDQVPEEEDLHLIVAVEDNLARRRIFSDMSQPGVVMANVIHPTAWVSKSAVLGRGIFIGPGVVINTQAEIDNGVMLDGQAFVDHHALVSPFSRLEPGARVLSRAEIGSLSVVGAGATIGQAQRLADSSQVPAGGVVNGAASPTPASG